VEFLHTTAPADLGVFALGLVIAAAVGGLGAGMLDIGGGIVVVPVLYHIMTALGTEAGVRMHVAAGTSLAAIIPASIARAHQERSAIEWPLVQRWTVPLLAGALFASVLAGLASGRVLALFFGVVALPIVLHLTFGGAKKRSDARSLGKAAGLVFPALIGGASTMTGIGANAIAVPMLGLFGVPAARAAGTASVFAAVAGLPAVFGAIVAGRHADSLPPWSAGYVNLLGFALVAPVLLALEPAGAALAHLIDLKRLRLVFAALIAIATARILWDALA